MTTVEDDTNASFQYLLHQGVRKGAALFLVLLNFTLDTYLIILSVQLGDILYHILESLLWLDLKLNTGLPGDWKTLYSIDMYLFIYLSIYTVLVPIYIYIYISSWYLSRHKSRFYSLPILVCLSLSFLSFYLSLSLFIYINIYLCVCVREYSHGFQSVQYKWVRKEIE